MKSMVTATLQGLRVPRQLHPSVGWAGQLSVGSGVQVGDGNVIIHGCHQSFMIAIVISIEVVITIVIVCDCGCNFEYCISP
jgi:hypothetical protein